MAIAGAPFSWFKERIVTLDQKHYVKEVMTIEGGVLTLSYTPSGLVLISYRRVETFPLSNQVTHMR